MGDSFGNLSRDGAWSALGLATFFLWTADYAVTQTFPIMDAKGSWFVRHFNHAFPFYVYAIFCVALVVVVLKLVPETKGLSLEEIERNWVEPGPSRSTPEEAACNPRYR